VLKNWTVLPELEFDSQKKEEFKKAVELESGRRITLKPIVQGLQLLNYSLSQVSSCILCYAMLIPTTLLHEVLFFYLIIITLSLYFEKLNTVIWLAYSKMH